MESMLCGIKIGYGFHMVRHDRKHCHVIWGWSIGMTGLIQNEKALNCWAKSIQIFNIMENLFDLWEVSFLRGVSHHKQEGLPQIIEEKKDWAKI